MIAIINHGVGNFGSISNALNKLCIDYVLTVDRDEILRSSGIIIPGVGSFKDGMAALRKFNLIDTLNYCALNEGIKKPILGICLGFQMMTTVSEEFGIDGGMNWISGSVKKFDFNHGSKNLRIPHVGWNDFKLLKKSQLMKDIPSDALFYYTHSYHLHPTNQSDVLGVSDYGYQFVAAVEKDNIYGVQFHPEKSQNWGLQLLKNFGVIANSC